jgi:hypothetical protein
MGGNTQLNRNRPRSFAVVAGRRGLEVIPAFQVGVVVTL